MSDILSISLNTGIFEITADTGQERRPPARPGFGVRLHILPEEQGSVGPILAGISKLSHLIFSNRRWIATSTCSRGLASRSRKADVAGKDCTFRTITHHFQGEPFWSLSSPSQSFTSHSKLLHNNFNLSGWTEYWWLHPCTRIFDHPVI